MSHPPFMQRNFSNWWFRPNRPKVMDLQHTAAAVVGERGTLEVQLRETGDPVQGAYLLQAACIGDSYHIRRSAATYQGGMTALVGSTGANHFGVDTALVGVLPTGDTTPNQPVPTPTQHVFPDGHFYRMTEVPLWIPGGDFISVQATNTNTAVQLFLSIAIVED